MCIRDRFQAKRQRHSQLTNSMRLYKTTYKSLRLFKTKAAIQIFVFFFWVCDCYFHFYNSKVAIEADWVLHTATHVHDKQDWVRKRIKRTTEYSVLFTLRPCSPNAILLCVQMLVDECVWDHFHQQTWDSITETSRCLGIEHLGLKDKANHIPSQNNNKQTNKTKTSRT